MTPQDHPTTATLSKNDTPVIEIRDLHKSYGSLEVLKGIDMTAPKGNVISLIGSSGSGKSTLLRCCNLLEDSQQGEIRFEGEAVRWQGKGLGRHPADRAQVTRIRTNLSMVFQQFNLWAHMTILQNVMEAPVTVLRRDPEEVEAAARKYLDKVGIGDKADVYPAMLSGGPSSNAPRLRARFAWNRAPCCLMSRPRRLIRNWNKRSSRSSRLWPKKAGRCYWSPMTCGLPPMCRTMWFSSIRGGPKKKAHRPSCSETRRQNVCVASFPRRPEAKVKNQKDN